MNASRRLLSSYSTALLSEAPAPFVCYPLHSRDCGLALCACHPCVDCCWIGRVWVSSVARCCLRKPGRGLLRLPLRAPCFPSSIPSKSAEASEDDSWAATASCSLNTSLPKSVCLLFSVGLASFSRSFTAVGAAPVASSSFTVFRAATAASSPPLLACLVSSFSAISAADGKPRRGWQAAPLRPLVSHR